MTTSRIVEIAPDAMTPEQHAVYTRLISGPRGRLPTPYKIWLHSPKLADAMEGLGTYLTMGSMFTDREIEIAVLIIARHLAAEYVFHVHCREARDLDLADDVIAAISTGTMPPLTDPRECAVARIALTLCKQPSVPAEVFQGADEVLKQRGIAELLALLGYYTSVAFATKFYAVPLPQPSK